MSLPFKIASQYLFSDRFFSKEGLLTNTILSALTLILLTIDVRYGIPILILHLLPFQFVKKQKLHLLIKVALAAGLMVAGYLELPFYVEILRWVIIGLSLYGIVLHFLEHKKISIRNIIFLLLTVLLLYSSYWVGVLFYILSLFIHQLFKGRQNAVHVISRISVLGISVGTAALILVLSVFNGFEGLIIGLFDAFNPDVKVTIAEGKTFSPDSSQIAALKQLAEVAAISKTVEEVAFFEYEGSQNFGIVKGVDKHFKTVSNVDSNLIRGIYGFKKGDTYYAVLGSGMEYKLAVNVENRLSTLNIYMPKRQKTPTLVDAFKKRFVYPLGTFAIQQEFDDQFVLVDLDFAQDLLSYEDEISALEIQLQPNSSQRDAIAKIKGIMGEEYEVKNRYQQNEAFFKLMNVEKWIGFAVLSFTLLLVSFNMVGALWMLALEKKKDIAILKSMGTLENTIQKIFIYKGVLLAFMGGIVGVYIALIFYFFQQQFSIIQLAGSANLLVDAYPISLKGMDFVWVFLIVLFIGVFAAWLPSIRAKKVMPLIRES
jgi:lipoprotein-releasing system permease protein